MAKPPEPIEEVLPKATWVVEAEVAEVLTQGPEVPKVPAPPGAADVGHHVRSQTVKLKVSRVLKGKVGTTELVAEKPVAGYALKTGNKGPFLLDDSKPNPVILGRYGPDTYRLPKIEDSLKAAR